MLNSGQGLATLVVVVVVGWGMGAGWGPKHQHCPYMQYLLQSLYATSEKKFSCKKEKKDERMKRDKRGQMKKQYQQDNMVLVIMVVTIKLVL